VTSSITAIVVSTSLEIKIKHVHRKEATTPARPHKQPHVLQRIRAIRNYCPKKTKIKIKNKNMHMGTKPMFIKAIRNYCSKKF
jgi:hypothetical protein